MSRKIVAREMLKELPHGFRVMRGYVYYQRYRHVIRGFLINGTSSKATWRLSTFTFPLFHTHKFIHIDYSRNVYDSTSWVEYSFEGDDAIIAAGMLQAITAAGLVEDAMNGWSAARFLEEYGVRNIDDTQPTRAFDLGCAAGLCGDLDFARRGLVSAREARLQIAQLYGPYRDHESFLQVVADGLDVLDQGVDAFELYMRQQTTVAAAAHGFCPPTFDS